MPKIVNHNEYRRKLLEKCFYLFCRKGYDKVTMREIASEIGISTGTIYHYFPKKQNMLEEMFNYIVEINVEEYLKRVESTKTDTLEERLHLLIDFVIDFEKFYKNVLLLVIDLFRIYDSSETEKIISSFSKYYTDTISRQLNLPEQFAKSLFTYIVGLVLHSLLVPNDTPFAENMRVLKNILKIGVGKSIEFDAEAKVIRFNTLLKENVGR